MLASSPNLEWIDRPCWAPDGRVVALEYRSTRWSLRRRYVAYGPTGARTILGRASRYTTHAALAPGCARVAERRRRMPLGGRGVMVRDLAGAALAELAAPADGLEWSPDGTLLTVASLHGGEARLTSVDPAGTTVAELLMTAPARVREATPSPDTGLVAVVLADGLHLFGRDGTALGLVAPGAGAHGVAWSPDGATIAFRRRGGVYVVPARPGAPRRRLLRSRTFGGPPPAWSPDGTRLAVATG